MVDVRLEPHRKYPVTLWLPGKHEVLSIEEARELRDKLDAVLCDCTYHKGERDG